MSDVPGRPLLEVGVPVYNESGTLRRTLESILAQTYTNLAVHVSDNGSTDGTAGICREFAARDSRLSYTTQPTTLEGPDNFRFLLERARAPYFAFLAGDDCWAPTFAERCIARLEADPEAVCSVSKVEFVGAEGGSRPALGTFELAQDVRARLITYLRNPEDNSRIFGIYRTPVLQSAFRQMPVAVAHDWLVCALTLAAGTHRELDEVLLFRDETPDVSYARFVDRWESGVADKSLPNLRVTRILLRNLPLRLGISLVPTLAYQNWRAMKHSPYALPRLGARISTRAGSAAARIRRS